VLWRLALAALGLLVAMAALASAVWLRLPAPETHAYAAASAVLAWFAAVHGGIALTMLGYASARVAAGFMGPQRGLELRVAGHWTGYACWVCAIALALLHLAPAWGPGVAG